MVLHRHGGLWTSRTPPSQEVDLRIILIECNGRVGQEGASPPDWEAWSEVFRCIRTTFLLLETVTPERLDGYAEHIRSLSARFGPTCWDIIYLGDVHMRSEHFERIRRKLTQNPNHGFTVASPWNAVYAQSVLEDSFWSKEVITPATLRLAKGSSVPSPVSTGLARG